jgi:hypothetical protein
MYWVLNEVERKYFDFVRLVPVGRFFVVVDFVCNKRSSRKLIVQNSRDVYSIGIDISGL